MKSYQIFLFIISFFFISCTSKPAKTEMTKDDYVLCFCQYIKATDGNGKIYESYYKVDYVMEKILAEHGYLPIAFPNFEAKSYWDKDICLAKTKIVAELMNHCLECKRAKSLETYLSTKNCSDEKQ